MKTRGDSWGMRLVVGGLNLTVTGVPSVLGRTSCKRKSVGTVKEQTRPLQTQWVSNGTLSTNHFVGQDLNGLLPLPQLVCSVWCVKSVSPPVSCESSVSVHVNLLLCRMNAEVEVKGETPIGVPQPPAAGKLLA